MTLRKAIQGKTSKSSSSGQQQRLQGRLDKDQLKSIFCNLVTVAWILTHCQIFYCSQKIVFIIIHRVFFHIEVLDIEEFSMSTFFFEVTAVFPFLCPYLPFLNLLCQNILLCYYIWSGQALIILAFCSEFDPF